MTTHFVDNLGWKDTHTHTHSLTELFPIVRRIIYPKEQMKTITCGNVRTHTANAQRQEERDENVEVVLNFDRHEGHVCVCVHEKLRNKQHNSNILGWQARIEIQILVNQPTWARKASSSIQVQPHGQGLVDGFACRRLCAAQRRLLLATTTTTRNETNPSSRLIGVDERYNTR